MLNVGLIGYGAVGKDVAKYIKEEKAGDVQLKAVLVRKKEKYNQLLKDLDCAVYDNKDEEAFFHSSLDVIIENAGHKAVYQYAVKSLSSGSHFIAISVGALADQDLLNRIEETAKKYQQKLFLPSAAIAGLDRIAAASLNDIDEIKLVTRKPVNAWKGTLAEQMVNLDTVTEPCCIYDGYAKESATLFPQSTNVSATLSLAGIGFEKTKVQVFVDPGIKNNSHQVIAKGRFGKLEIKVQNTPSAANPKSGYIVAMSICKVLKDLSSPIVVGI